VVLATTFEYWHYGTSVIDAIRQHVIATAQNDRAKSVNIVRTPT
jgi:hypothetical protein